jgi:hypothetical protein
MTPTKRLIFVVTLGGLVATIGCTKASELKAGSVKEQSPASARQNVDPCAVIRDDGVTFVWGTPGAKVQKQMDTREDPFWLCTYVGPDGSLWLRVSVDTELDGAKAVFRGNTGGLRTGQRFQTESGIGDEAASACATMSCKGVEFAVRKNTFNVQMGANGFDEQKEPVVREKLRSMARKVVNRL